MRRRRRLAPLLAFVALVVLTGMPRRATADELCSASVEEVSRLSAPLRMKMKELGEMLAPRIDSCATEARRSDGEQFWKAHGLEATPVRLRDYVRTRTLFELTRDGGPWRVRWAITNQEPTAKKIWETWQAHPPAEVSATPSVTAERDEISALFAGLSRRVGVRGVGLFWPTKDHTIAAWEPAAGVRVLVPTTQIYASCSDTFDHTPFSPSVQKTVFELPATDAPDSMAVPRTLAAFLLAQVTHYAGASLDLLATLRIHRALTFGSSVRSTCRESMTTSARALRGAALTSGDRRALLRYGTELGLTTTNPAEVLDRLSSPSPRAP